jgi:putative FmdB family regulatory protein
MPLYEYYCDNCDEVFESLGSVSASDKPAKCPKCGAASDRIMPTSFASMVRKDGWKQRAPFHHHDVRNKAPKKSIARVKPKTAAKPKSEGKRSSSTKVKD